MAVALSIVSDTRRVSEDQFRGIEPWILGTMASMAFLVFRGWKVELSFDLLEYIFC